jgi:hypothetical protein
MAKQKRKTLPKNFEDLIKAGDMAALQAVFAECALDACARDGETALHFWRAPDELVRWLVGQGLDVNTATHTYKKTPLHESTGVSISGGQERVNLLLALGADVDAADSSGNTPLHYAEHNPDTVQILITHGADIHAENHSQQTPLSYALARCSNADISSVAKVAALLLDAGAKIMPDMQESIRRIGKNFEFHREGFNEDCLAETDAGLARLYQLFGVEPVARQRRHDGVSPITVTATDWRAQHSELWNLLVPSQGPAQTVQGEVIRITGRVSYEIMDTGGINWDDDFHKMLDALARHLGTGTPLVPRELAKATELVAVLRDGDGNDAPLQLTELAVRWVLKNPQPMPLAKPDYRR